ncbi:3-deoxy-7-phosphoheptulonate synthase [Pseudofulvibacter geojedonensis]|uniref:3-deoxy-7-phosphoheptulonate synthase n=1 Tax=Pseudofulvibacter geojedonensis TaxID=1123758 RepID=A0ABW3HZS8_9FLAO
MKKIKTGKPYVIAGPCSAESEEQVLSIAHSLKETNVDVFRAGIWKPRTRPGNFEGIGEKGLSWLKRVKDETGLETAVEVANPKHVELALKNDVDVLWIGSRTTVSPFTVQEIANACNGIENRILIKNPINPDLSLWMGAIERFSGQNIKKLGAIHRGFSSYEKIKYRNAPIWEIPLGLRREFPDLPIIFDPSHVAGDRNLVFDLSRTALSLNFDGLIIETHNNPDKAWSDAKQQVLPEVLLAMLDHLLYREGELSLDPSIEKLLELDFRIDTLKDQLGDVFLKKRDLKEQIGLIKEEQRISSFV